MTRRERKFGKKGAKWMLGFASKRKARAAYAKRRRNENGL